MINFPRKWNAPWQGPESKPVMAQARGVPAGGGRGRRTPAAWDRERLQRGAQALLTLRASNGEAS
jgi:hypothetical protein